MNIEDRRNALVRRLFHTSVVDAQISLQSVNDPVVLLDLLIMCHDKGHRSREEIVRQRIAKLIKSR